MRYQINHSAYFIRNRLIIQMRIKQIKTEHNVYHNHLQLTQTCSFYKEPTVTPITPVSTHSIPMPTNFAGTLTNPYAFILLHLKKVTNTNNKLRINIPQVCIFVSGIAQQIFYSQGGEIKSLKGKDGLRLSEVFSFFRNKNSKKNLNKEQNILACFQNQSYTILNDTDFLILCRKFRNDPIFAKLEYLRNKISNSNNVILESIYNSETDFIYSGEATEGLLAMLSEEQRKLQMKQQHYLHYLNGKIALFLNLQNNIRLSYAHFYYNRTSTGQYYLIDVKYLQFTNLTNALRQRQKRLKAAEEERNKILIMSPEKQRRYKSYENSKGTKQIEGMMNKHWEDLSNKTRIVPNNDRITQEKRNEQVFNLLFSRVGVTLSDIVTSKDFRKTRREILGHDKRKTPSKKWRVHINYKKSHQRYVTEPVDTQ